MKKSLKVCACTLCGEAYNGPATSVACDKCSGEANSQWSDLIKKVEELLKKEWGARIEAVKTGPLNALAARIYEWCERKGWNENLLLGNMMTNLHSEISEAWEEIRNGHGPTEFYRNGDSESKPEGFGIELADLIIRILHITAHYKLDIDRLIAIKMAYNETRPRRHGGKTA